MSKAILSGIDYGRDLDAYIPDAPNFQYWEVVSSNIAVRHNIANVPTEAQWKAAENFARFVLQPLRYKFGRLNISSWFRCPALNTKVGSGPSSFHLTGGAADVEPEEVTLMELLDGAYSLANISEIIAEFFPHGWVHIGYLVGDNRRMLKLKDPTHNYSRVTLDQLKQLYTKG